jgi:hypothetical protein
VTEVIRLSPLCSQCVGNGEVLARPPPQIPPHSRLGAAKWYVKPVDCSATDPVAGFTVRGGEQVLHASGQQQRVQRS